MAQQPHEVVFFFASPPRSGEDLVADPGVADGPRGNEPITVKELAASSGVSIRSRPAGCAPTLSSNQDNTCGRAEVARACCAATSQLSMRPFVRMMGLPFMWGSLTDSSTQSSTGSPADDTGGTGGDTYLPAGP